MFYILYIYVIYKSYSIGSYVTCYRYICHIIMHITCALYVVLHVICLPTHINMLHMCIYMCTMYMSYNA